MSKKPRAPKAQGPVEPTPADCSVPSPIQVRLIEGPWHKSPLAVFAAASASAALLSVIAAGVSLYVAQGQAAISRMQYTPQLALDMRQPQLVMNPPTGAPMVVSAALIKNVGSITVYNAAVTAWMDYLPPNRIAEIWNKMPAADTGVTLAPTETETVPVFTVGPNDDRYRQMQSGQLVLVMVGRIQFVDELRRAHTRYTCARASIDKNGQLAASYCPTPQQG